MSVFLIIVHVIVCIALILIVLLQTGKGAEMGAAFGGSSQTLFGGAGPAPFLGKVTTAAAIVFMLTSLALAYISAHPFGDSIMKNVEPVAEQPAATVPAGVGELPDQADAPAPQSVPAAAQPAEAPPAE